MITLSNLLQLLTENPDAGMTVRLPGGSDVPAHFHVTEVGRVRKDFIDCGGTVRSTDRCVLQVWVAGDTDHRVTAGKLAKIIELARPLLGGSAADLQVEVEYDIGVITQLTLVAAAQRDGVVLLELEGKQTACLAPDRCGTPAGGAAGVDANACSAPGCCAPPKESAPVSLGARK